MRRRRVFLLIALLGTGCGASSAAPSGAPAGPDTDAGAPAADASSGPLDAGGQAEAAAPCSAPPDQRPDGGTCVLEATGTVQDLAGAPLPDLVMTMCSPARCYGSRADDAGVYTVPVGDFILTQSYAVHADGRPDHAVDYFRLSAGEPQVITVDMHLPPLPASSVLLPPDGTPATSVTVGDFTLQIAAGTTFDLDIEDFGNGAAGRTLRVAPVPLGSAPPYAAAANVDAIYALAPSGAKPSQKMGVLLRNAAGLPASAAVDLLVLSDDYFSDPPSVGTLVLEAAAHVSADGASIQTDPGEGIGEITWLAVRQKGK